MVKWDDQSRFRGLFSMEWYVLGNGPWDYSAMHPKQPSNTAAAAADEASGMGASSVSSKLPRKARKAPESTHSSSSSISGQVLGWQYRGYPNGTHAERSAGSNAATAAEVQAAAAAADAGFNTIEAGVVAATRSLFTGQLDGLKFMPQRTGGP